MKDRNGNYLPEPKEEYSGTIPSDAPNGSRCHSCQGQIKPGKMWTMRFYDQSGNKPKVQGPLCPHCSELPAEYLPSRNMNERWW